MHTLLIDVHVIEGSVPFLFGKDTGTSWEAELKMKEEKLNLRVSKDVIVSPHGARPDQGGRCVRRGQEGHSGVSVVALT